MFLSALRSTRSQTQFLRIADSASLFPPADFRTQLVSVTLRGTSRNSASFAIAGIEYNSTTNLESFSACPWASARVPENKPVCMFTQQHRRSKQSED